jgi:hypothetical protein
VSSRSDTQSNPAPSWQSIPSLVPARPEGLRCTPRTDITHLARVSGDELLSGKCANPGRGRISRQWDEQTRTNVEQPL